MAEGFACPEEPRRSAVSGGRKRPTDYVGPDEGGGSHQVWPQRGWMGEETLRYSGPWSVPLFFCPRHGIVGHLKDPQQGSWEFAQSVMWFVDLEKAFDRVPQGVPVDGCLRVWGVGTLDMGRPVLV